MTYKENNYISKLLNDSSKLHDINDLRGFLKNLDIKRIEEQLDNEIALSTSFSDRNLYQRYPKYEKHWLTYVTILKDIILSGEENLSRVAKKVQDSFPLKRSRITNEAVFLGEQKKVPPEVIIPWRDALALAFLAKNCNQDTECVIEVGSGPALILFKFWLSNGPVDATYYALEITQTARLCANILACLEPSISFNSLFFDYQKPDFSALRDKYKRIFVFTHGSIEQIPKLQKTFFTELLLTSEQLTCVHFEPVGWQIIKPIKQDSLTRNHRRRCEKKNHNTNLWPLLKEFESRQLIRINDYSINLIGKADHYATYISWTKLP